MSTWTLLDYRIGALACGTQVPYYPIYSNFSTSILKIFILFRRFMGVQAEITKCLESTFGKIGKGSLLHPYYYSFSGGHRSTDQVLQRSSEHPEI